MPLLSLTPCHSVNGESWRLRSSGPLSHCHERNTDSPFADLRLTAVKAVTILHTTVQYKLYPFTLSLRDCMSWQKNRQKIRGFCTESGGQSRKTTWIETDMIGIVWGRNSRHGTKWKGKSREQAQSKILNQWLNRQLKLPYLVLFSIQVHPNIQ